MLKIISQYPNGTFFKVSWRLRQIIVEGILDTIYETDNGLEGDKAYQEYFEIDGDSNVDYKASGFFVKKYTYETAFPFSASSAASIKNLYNTCLNVWGTTFEIDIQKQTYLKDIFDDMTFTYQLISISKTLRSENFESEGGLFYNTFTKSQAELEENPNISLYLFYISRGWWYLLALVVTLICVLVAFLILKKKHKKA